MHHTSLILRRAFSMAANRRQKSPYWREAATLILAAPVQESNVGSAGSGNDNFKVLMLKRDAASSFMPNAFVYPGGMRSPADFDRERWNSIFQGNANISMKYIEQMLEISGERSPMLLPNSEQDADELSADVGFRICSIRETFEESGILLVSHKDDLAANPVHNRHSHPPIYTLPDDFDVKAWRKRVSTNAQDFCQLCEEYNVVPNLWALYEWSNWLTPVTRKIEKPPVKPKRFDTMFYMCCLDRPLEGAEACSEETTEAHWKSPHEWSSGHNDGSTKMFGPQIYETAKLTAFTSRMVLSSYIKQREPIGMIQYLPVVFMCNDGVFFLLPGDEQYPANPDVNGTEDIGVIAQDLKTLLTIQPECRYHRAGPDEHTYLCTIKLPCGLLSTENNHEDPMTVLGRSLSKL